MEQRKRFPLGKLLYYLYLLLAAALFIYSRTAHPLLIDRGLGTSRRLQGSVTLHAVFVSEETAPWTDAEVALMQQELREAARRLEQDASTYGASLSICIECHHADAPAAFDRDEYRRWARQVLNHTPTLSRPGYLAYRDQPVLFLLNKPGRAFANVSRLPQMEYAFLFEGDGESIVRHELLHLYGAEDYYVHSDVKAAAQALCPDSIMLSSAGAARMDSLTAYVVGWAAEPDETARHMLEETRHVSTRAFSDARAADQKDGYATISKDDWTYTGDLVHGSPHGHGIMRWADGSVYDGQWENGAYHGEGTLRWNSGDVYTGEFVRCVPEGRGTLQWSSGTVYSGDFSGGQPHGKGTFTWPDGSSYTGSVANGSRTGWGMFRFANGDVYTGELLDGRFTGQGVLRFANGDMYSGGFLDDQLHGSGCLTRADGSRQTGQWEHGYCLSGSSPQ